MHSNRPIPLYPNPPPSPKQTQDVLLSDDFPPCRVHETTPETTPDPPIHSRASRSHLRSSAARQIRKAATKRGSPSQSEASPAQPSSRNSRHSQNTELGQKNIVNTIEVTVQNHIPKTSSKRGLVAADDRPSKRQCRTSVGKTDMDWIKDEVNDIKLCIREIADHIRGEVDVKIEEVLHRLQQMRDMELGY